MPLSFLPRILISDLQEAVENQTGLRSHRNRRSVSEYNYEVYHSLEEVRKNSYCSSYPLHFTLFKFWLPVHLQKCSKCLFFKNKHLHEHRYIFYICIQGLYLHVTIFDSFWVFFLNWIFYSDGIRDFIEGLVSPSRLSKTYEQVLKYLHKRPKDLKPLQYRLMYKGYHPVR